MSDISPAILDNFSDRTIAVIGDLVADQYLNGTISRVSREAPVFILRHDRTSTFPGAAANAAANVASLGGRSLAVGVIGDDDNGRALADGLDAGGVDRSFVITAPGRSTTTKVRILAGHQHASRQQVIRVDYEESEPLTDELVSQLRSNVERSVAVADGVIISDYGYGVVGDEIFQIALDLAKRSGKPLVVDSRFRLSDHRGATSATPNQEEVQQILGPGFDTDACERFRRELGLEALLVTNGSHGMTLFDNGLPPYEIDAVGSDQAIDVTGAGDTVIAAYTLALASGSGYRDAAIIANHCGGSVVMKKGTAVVTRDELIASLGAQPAAERSRSTR